jgi:hypothetical protein
MGVCPRVVMSPSRPGGVAGGEGGIRTRDGLPRTAFPVRRHSPLGDLSAEESIGTLSAKPALAHRGPRHPRGHRPEVWRRGRDSNPRCFRTPLFESGTINHSDTSPRQRIPKGPIHRPPGDRARDCRLPMGVVLIRVGRTIPMPLGPAGPLARSAATLWRSRRDPGRRDSDVPPPGLVNDTSTPAQVAGARRLRGNIRRANENRIGRARPSAGIGDPERDHECCPLRVERDRHESYASREYRAPRHGEVAAEPSGSRSRRRRTAPRPPPDECR